MAIVAFESVRKEFPDGTVAVEELDLEVADGEFIVFVGPSGSGKSTVLRMLAGLENVSDGSIRINDVEVNELSPRNRDIAMVFQDYALYPHMSVRDNLAFGLRLRGVEKHARRERVLQVAEMLNIVDQLDRQPRQLSGGQRQRVAMGRAIIREPQALLMDEPLSNLDAKLRVHMRAEIMRLHRRVGTTTLYVTHDQVEAMTMAERVAVLRQGRLEQVDTPDVLYREPANVFVAGFMGSPAMNFMVATLETNANGLAAVVGPQRIEIPAQVLQEWPAVSRYAGRDVVLGVRPEDIEEVGRDSQESGGLEAIVEVVERLGSEVIAHCEIDAPPFRAGDLQDLFRDVDEATGRQNEVHTTRLIARFADTSRVRAGDRVRVSVDLQRLYLFDPTTEARIS